MSTDSGGCEAAGSGGCVCTAHLRGCAGPGLGRGGTSGSGGTSGPSSPHCQLAQLPGRLCRMASRFCLSARISARSLSKLWICSSCSLDSSSKSLSFPCRAPGGPSRSLRCSSVRWVSSRALAGALWVSSNPGQRSTDRLREGAGSPPLEGPPQPQIFRIPTAPPPHSYQESKSPRGQRGEAGEGLGQVCTPPSSCA